MLEHGVGEAGAGGDADEVDAASVWEDEVRLLVLVGGELVEVEGMGGADAEGARLGVPRPRVAREVQREEARVRQIGLGEDEQAAAQVDRLSIGRVFPGFWVLPEAGCRCRR